VSPKIDGPKELRGYRAFWRYLAGNAAWLAHKAGVESMDVVARGFYSDAAAASIGVSWLHKLKRYGLANAIEGKFDDSSLDSVIERLEQQLENLGMANDRRFDQRVKNIFEGLNQTTAGPFENGQVLLGRLLGYSAENSSDDSAPDPWWILNNTEGIVFEDYTDCKKGAVISTEKARQAASHPGWLNAVEDYKNIHFDVVFVTPAKRLGGGARPSADKSYYWEMNDFVAWATKAVTMIRQLRRSFNSPGDLVWRAEAKDAYLREGLNPKSFKERACRDRLSEIG
jgi:hypothetical protein